MFVNPCVLGFLIVFAIIGVVAYFYACYSVINHGIEERRKEEEKILNDKIAKCVNLALKNKKGGK